jgi:alpha-beta hydrolase superfamily lysophospholipase
MAMAKNFLSVRKTSALLLGSLVGLSSAFALPEASLGTHQTPAILEAIATISNIDDLRAELSKTGVPVLDSLWDSRVDMTAGTCDKVTNNCRVISLFRGKTTDKPVVLLPGFTGYRKMYLEQIYDLMEAGYGPIYISDFSGTGDSFKQELAPGESQRLAAKYAQHVPGGDLVLKNKVDSVLKGTLAPEKIPAVLEALRNIPVGLGYITNFDLYVSDVNVIMNTVVRDNPGTKVMIVSLSMSGLSLPEAIAAQSDAPTWIKSVGRIVLESPMINVKATGQFLVMKGLRAAATATPTETAGQAQQLEPYVIRALGIYDPSNAISHSPTRLSMTDAVRAWSGHDTFGATFSWAAEEAEHQYTYDSMTLTLNPKTLNRKLPKIVNALKSNGVALTIVCSEADAVVDTMTTKVFSAALAKGGLSNNLCLFKTANHVIDQETDKYRVPYMELLVDQKDAVVKPAYGDPALHEVLNCIENK